MIPLIEFKRDIKYFQLSYWSLLKMELAWVLRQGGAAPGHTSMWETPSSLAANGKGAPCSILMKMFWACHSLQGAQGLIRQYLWVPGSHVDGEGIAEGGSGQEGKTRSVSSPSLAFLSQPLQFERDRKCRGSKAGVQGEAAGSSGRAGRTEEKAGRAPENHGGRGAEEEAGGGWEKSQRGGKCEIRGTGLQLYYFVVTTLLPVALH